MLGMRPLAILSGAVAIVAVVLATIASRAFGDVETATSVLTFAFAAAVICGGCIYADKRQPHLSYTDDRDH
ncbi:hypothetical protein ASG84_08930 [Rhodococcus sp. Leaf278]|nr:hypothetical protein ASG84_08930 [Rhodococcus sp. Leaf278]